MIINRVGPALRTSAAAVSVLGLAALAFALGGSAPAGASAAHTAAPQTTTHACGNDSLTVNRTQTSGAAGTSGFVLIYRNQHTVPCTIHGFPGYDAVSSTGHVLAHAKRVGSTGPVTTVAPGAYVSSLVTWSNFNTTNGHDCAYSASSATTVANTTRVVHLPVAVSLCNLSVTATVHGTHGNLGFANAQVEWIRGSHADDANVGSYWSKARTDLVPSADYGSQRAELAQLIRLPRTGLTPSEKRAVRHDVAELDAFFATPGLYT